QPRWLVPVERFETFADAPPHPADATAVADRLLGRNAKPGVVHSGRFANFFANELFDGLTGEPLDDFSKHEPTRRGVIARRLADHPIVLDGSRINRGERFVPARLRITRLDVSNSGGVSQQMANRDRVFAVLAELGQMSFDAIIKGQFPSLLQKSDRNGRERLAR